MLSADALRSRIREIVPEFIRIRHDLHQHPELAYQERRTSGVVVTELKKMGVQHVPGLAGGTGVLGYIPPTRQNAANTGSIALRADMDALPITEKTGAAYASKTPGVMHACGHDGHTANLLAVAKVLTSLDDRPNGVTLIFQPAEEGGAGGKRMCEDGALDGSRIGTPVREIYGLHGWPQYELGLVGSKPGPMLAATDNFVVRIKGTQAHAAYPQLSADPIVGAAQVITALQTICSRNIAPQDSIVVTVATINAGTARNIIPAEVVFSGTMRTLNPETRILGKRRFYEIAQGVAAGMGCRAEIEWEEGYPVTYNDEALTAKFFRIAEQAIGAQRVPHVGSPSLGGEDFSYYGQRIPACFFILGMKPKDRESYPSLHQPEYDFNDDAMATGVEVMCRLALAVE